MGKRELKIEVVWDGSKGEKGLATLSDSAAKAEGAFSKVGGKLSDLGGKFTKFATLPIAAGFAAAINSASDLAESTNITGVTFGKAREKVDEFAKSAAKSLGQSERAARDATAQFGGLLQNLGFTEDASADASIQLTKLASDLGSAFNKDPAEAVQALGSALRGESEPIRAFNVMLDDASVRAKAVEMGLATTTAEVDKHGKAQASLALIMQQTSKVQGDFANTADGLANQTRIAKAELEDTAAKIGADLLPIALDAAGALRKLVGVFAEMDPVVQKAALGGAAFLAAIGPVLTLAGNAAKGIDGLKRAFDALGLAGSASVSLLAVGIGLFVKELVEAKAKAGELVRSLEGDLASASVTELEEALARVHLELEDQIETWKDFGVAGGAVRQMVETLTPLKDRVAENDAAVNALADSEERLRARLVHTQENMVAVANATGLTTDEVEQLATKAGVDLSGGFTETTKALVAAWTQMNTSRVGSEQLAEAQETLGSKVKTATEELNAFKNALDLALGSTLEADQASIKWQESLLTLTETVKANGTEFGFNTEKQRAVATAIIGAVEAAKQETLAFAEAGRITSDSATLTENFRQRLELLKQKFPQLAPVIDGYIGKVGAIPDHATTTVTANVGQANAALDSTLARLERLKRQKQATIDLNAKAGLHTPGGGMAGGGVVKATPGGVDVTVAEGGEDEAVVTLAGGGEIPVAFKGNGSRAPAPAAAEAATGPVVVNVHWAPTIRIEPPPLSTYEEQRRLADKVNEVLVFHGDQIAKTMRTKFQRLAAQGVPGLSAFS